MHTSSDTKPVSPSIGRSIWFIHRKIVCFLNRAFTQHGLSSGLFRYLITIARHDGLNQEQLSSLLDVDKTTTTRGIVRLEKAGFIQREINESDHRAYCLHLTPHGQDMLPLIQRVLSELSDQLVKDFTPRERELVQMYLQRIQENADDMIGVDRLPGEK